MSLAERLGAALALRKLNPGTAAQLAGLSAASVAAWATGAESPTLAQLAQLSNAFAAHDNGGAILLALAPDASELRPGAAPQRGPKHALLRSGRAPRLPAAAQSPAAWALAQAQRGAGVACPRCGAALAWAELPLSARAIAARRR